MIWQGTGPVTANMAAFGDDDDKLGDKVRQQENNVRNVFPTITFQRTPPHDLYVLLDADNIAVLLNGLNFNTAYTNATNTSLLTATGFLSGITATESPRKTWSHGH